MAVPCPTCGGAVRVMGDNTTQYYEAIDRPRLSLYGYVCRECATWAEDMTPHCFMGHDADPVETLPFYVEAK